MMLKCIFCFLQRILNYTRVVDFLAPLAIRLYLIPVFWMAGTNKWENIDSTIAWFGSNSGLGFSHPTLLAYTATLTELIGTFCLLFGIALRWISIPLMVVMAVAAFSVHWEHGWFAIAPDTSVAAQRLQGFLNWLSSNFPGRHAFITEKGQPVMLNNGIEFAVTYFIMLMVLFFHGAGQYVSVDYWVDRKLKQKKPGNKKAH